MISRSEETFREGRRFGNNKGHVLFSVNARSASFENCIDLVFSN